KKPAEVFNFSSYNHVTTDCVLDAECPAKIDQLMPAFHTIFGAVAVGLIVDARVDNARVVARLMCGYVLLFFKDQDIKIGIRFGEFIGGRKPDNTGADNNKIVGFHASILN